MGETDYNTLLYEKMKTEQDKYRDWLLTQEPAEILNHTYEYTMREDIVMAMEGLELTPKRAKALLKSPCPLDDVYKEFKDREVEHMLDERKQLNDAYTHDLRTPIAVLKGYTDMLIGYLPTGKFSEDEILETVQTMSSHVERLEQFADSMNTVQELEDIDIQKEQVPAEEFLSHLRETADFLCQSQDIAFEFESSLARATILIDPSAVTQVFENLLNNALRFAEEKITILCLANDNIFSIAVTDDGKGFSEKELITAAKPYYSGQAEKGQLHFGLGLHICRTLCEKHGGTLRLENTEPHGAKVTASFYISPLSI